MRGRRRRTACAVAVAACAAVAGSASPRQVAAGAPVEVTCTRRVMQVVAHADDDLLFMNPDVQADIATPGSCVRTVVVSAGDSGRRASYWSAREAGARAAYARMAGVADAWSASDAGVSGRSLRVQTLTADPAVSLVFLRLPDGNRGPGQDGRGFATYGRVSLERLWAGAVARVTSVDRAETYTKSELVDVLARLMRAFAPGTIRVQDSYGALGPYHDHSDHLTAARFATAAQAYYAAPHTLVGYLGYGARHRPGNVRGRPLLGKKAAFYAYGRHDEVCRSDAACEGSKTEAWLRRRYVVTPTFAPLAGTDGSCLDLDGRRVRTSPCTSAATQGFAPQPGGEVRALGHTCLDAGAAVTVAPCLGVPAQAWRLADDGTLRHDGRCLTRLPADAIVLTTCTGAAEQRWTWGTPLRNDLGGCVDATARRLAACDSTDARWGFTGTAELRGPGGRCLDAGDATSVRLATCLGEARQTWFRGPDESIVGPGGGCLTAGADGALLVAPCTGAGRQRWSLRGTA